MTLTEEQESFELLADEAMDHWRRAFRLRRGYAPSEVTVYNKRRSLTIMNRTAQEVFPEIPHALVALLEDRRAFLEWKTLVGERVSTGTLRNYVYALQGFEAYLLSIGRISQPVIEEPDIPANNQPPPITIYTESELDRLVKASWMGGYRWAAFIHFLAATGRRVGEALRLEFTMLREDREGFYFELERTKNGEQNYVPVPDDFARTFLRGEGWQELLHEYDTGRVQFTRDPGVYLFPWSYTSVHGRFTRMCERTKVENRGFHNFRHTVITNRIAAGVPLQAVAALAGHRNPSLTATRYNHATALNFRKYLSSETEAPSPG